MPSGPATGAAAGLSQPLLTDPEHFGHEEDAFVPTTRPFSGFQVEPTFQLLNRIRTEVQTILDTPLTYEQLRQPTINFSVVRPLSLKLSRGGQRPPPALIYSLLVCRVHFLDVASDDLAFAALNTSRADLCELLAIKLLSAYGTAPVSLELLHILTTPFNPMHGATVDCFADEEDVDDAALEKLVDWGKDEQTNALELAIFSKAKRFVRSPLVQQIIKSIHTGQVLYSPESAHAFIRDDYKVRPIVQVYDWRTQPFLDHNRLRVPQIRNRLEFLTFAVILFLFMACQLTHDSSRVTIWEALFVLWSLGFALDEVASMQENGLTIYSSGAYNVMDALFVLAFLVYFVMRLDGLWTGDEAMSDLSFDTLALAGCLLFPRLAISLLRGNVVLMALSAMIKEYIVFMALASLTASGFLVTFVLLSRGTWSWGRTAWLLLKVWLGSSFLAFDVAQDFSKYYGPALVVVFATLSQTLLLTILVSLLSNTFAAIQGQAETEILHQQALRTIERVKSDATSSYLPPFNLVALLVLLPMRALATPRWTHKTHVFLTKTLNFPILLCLALSTRARHRRTYLAEIVQTTKKAWHSLPRTIPFEGTVDSISHVFDRHVTAEALKVPSIDEPLTPDQDSPVEPQTAASVIANPPMFPSASKSTTPSKADGPGGGGKRHAPVRSKSQGPVLAAGQQHSRMGSLASPLAKIFNVENVAKAQQQQQQQQGTGDASLGNKAIEARLDSIEQSLRVLLVELAKSNMKDEDRPPLTSLTGAIEQDLGSATDDA
ncbi:hypothetical protein ACM66B_001522 [Microbotryomycetes sp. NB124-2]